MRDGRPPRRLAGVHGAGPRHQPRHQARRRVPDVLQQALERRPLHARRLQGDGLFRRRRGCDDDDGGRVKGEVPQARVSGQVHSVAPREDLGPHGRASDELRLRRRRPVPLRVLPERPLRRLSGVRQARRLRRRGKRRRRPGGRGSNNKERQLLLEGGRDPREDDAVALLGRGASGVASVVPLRDGRTLAAAAALEESAGQPRVDHGRRLPDDVEHPRAPRGEERRRRSADGRRPRVRDGRAVLTSAVRPPAESGRQVLRQDQGLEDRRSLPGPATGLRHPGQRRNPHRPPRRRPRPRRLRDHHRRRSSDGPRRLKRPRRRRRRDHQAHEANRRPPAPHRQAPSQAGRPHLPRQGTGKTTQRRRRQARQLRRTPRHRPSRHRHVAEHPKSALTPLLLLSTGPSSPRHFLPPLPPSLPQSGREPPGEKKRAIYPPGNSISLVSLPLPPLLPSFVRSCESPSVDM
mmetsp:Transcript_6070/g.19784  ORF Transcript_6070/g.19784 Transcript_6070/m.19784 type:complete len:463 (-) Transcript_6070:79-1467(-)